MGQCGWGLFLLLSANDGLKEVIEDNSNKYSNTKIIDELMQALIGFHYPRILKENYSKWGRMFFLGE
jgi:hypothetical protein